MIYNNLDKAIVLWFNHQVNIYEAFNSEAWKDLFFILLQFCLGFFQLVDILELCFNESF